MAEIRHGTGSGYCNQACRCDECRRWARERMAADRKSKPDLRAREMAAHRAEARAMRTLAASHPVEFERYYNQERSLEGLPPIGTVPLGRPPKAAVS